MLSFLGDSGSLFIFHLFVQVFRLTMVSSGSPVGVYKVFPFHVSVRDAVPATLVPTPPHRRGGGVIWTDRKIPSGEAQAQEEREKGSGIFNDAGGNVLGHNLTAGCKGAETGYIFGRAL